MSDLKVLLVHHDDHSRSVLDPGLPAEAAGHAQPQDMASALDSEYLCTFTGDHNDLGKGYCVVAPRGQRGDRLLALAAPLIARRQSDVNSGLSAGQSERTVKILRVPTREQLGGELDWDTAVQWVLDNLEPPEAHGRDFPYYRLILGDLHEVPLAIQRALTVNGIAGRLAFDRDGDYDAYVAKLLASETRTVPDTWPDLSMYSVLDGTPETAEWHRTLARPAFAPLELEFDCHDWPHIARLHESNSPSADHLCQIARAADSSVLFTLSHGTGAPRGGWNGDHERQRRFQGAMSFGANGRLGSEELTGGSFLPGGVWFMNASFSAGTPTHSVYQPWLQRLVDIGYASHDLIGNVLHSLPAHGGRPFIAALPKAALASSDGPLGFIGHIDLTWVYGFGEQADRHRGHGKQIDVFRAVLDRLSQGYRFGACFRRLTHYLYGNIAAEFEAMVKHATETEVMTNPRLVHLWMMSQDLRGYMLLGDPAARILAPGRERWRLRPAERVQGRGRRPR